MRMMRNTLVCRFIFKSTVIFAIFSHLWLYYTLCEKYMRDIKCNWQVLYLQMHNRKTNIKLSHKLFVIYAYILDLTEEKLIVSKPIGEYERRSRLRFLIAQ